MRPVVALASILAPDLHPWWGSPLAALAGACVDIYDGRLLSTFVARVGYRWLDDRAQTTSAPAGWLDIPTERAIDRFEPIKQQLLDWIDTVVTSSRDNRPLLIAADGDAHLLERDLRLPGRAPLVVHELKTLLAAHGLASDLDRGQLAGRLSVMPLESVQPLLIQRAVCIASCAGLAVDPVYYTLITRPRTSGELNAFTAHGY